MAARRLCGSGKRQRRSSWGLGVALVVAVASMVACGGGGSRPSASSTAISQFTPQATTASTEAAHELTIMPLGDSLTEGGDPARPTTSPQSYRGYLSTALADAGHDVDFVGSQQSEAIGGGDPDHEGHGGYTIGPDEAKQCDTCEPSNIDSGIEGWLAASKPDVVLLLIGVNDLLPDATRPVVPAEAAGKLTALVAKIRTLAPGATVIVASYPPTSFLVDPSLNSHGPFAALNAAAKAAGDGRDDHVLYAPMFETFQGSWTNEDVLGTADQLHPSATGAKRIADVWFSVLEPVLAAR